MTSRIRFISRLLRRRDARKHASPSIPALGWQIFLINQDYRDRHYYQINRGRG